MRKWKLYFLGILVIPALSVANTVLKRDANHASANKALVSAFYQQMFVDKQVNEAIETYIGDTYIQHNPFVEDGKSPLANIFEGYFARFPKAGVDIKRVIAEGDLVVVHSHWTTSEVDAGKAVFDIFRVENHKIVEHWDAVQAVPAVSKNSNTMF